MIQLSLAQGVLGNEKTELLVKAYLNTVQKGIPHDMVEDEIIDYIQDNFDEEIENYCNTHGIFSNMKVAEDIVEELKKLNK